MAYKRISPQPVIEGGTGTITNTNHGVLLGQGTSAIVATSVGATNTALLGNTGADPSFGAVPNAALVNSTVTLSSGNNLTVTGGGPLALGGTASFNVTGTTTHALQIGNASGSLTSLAVATNGQIPIGSTGADPVLAALSAGTGITITNGAGTITIATTGSGFTWFDVTSGSATLAAESGYIADKSTLTTFTMPTNNAFGDTIKIVGKGTGLWKIVYGTGQNIVFGSSTSTTTTGNITSTNAGDCVELVCTTASASAPIFTVVNCIGNPSIT